MAARTKNSRQSLKRGSKQEMVAKIEAGREERKAQVQAVIEDHLPPLLLVCCILACSGAMFIFCLRDFWTTGKNIAGSWDEALLVSLSCPNNFYSCICAAFDRASTGRSTA